MDNSRNMILAFVLSALVLIGWTSLSERFFPTPKPATNVAQTGTTASNTPVTAPVAQAASKLRDVATVRAESPRVIIETPKLSGSINLRGAQIDDLVMTAYKETIKKDSPAVRLFAPSGSKNAFFSGFGWIGDGVQMPNAQTIWQADQPTLTPEKPVTLRWANTTGQSFAIKISVDRDYMFSVEQSVGNTGVGAIAARPYSYVSRFGQSKDLDTWTNHVGPIGAFNDSVNFDVDFSTLDEAGAAGTRFQSKGGWLGFGDLHWLAAIIPAKDASIDAGFRAADGSYQAEYTLPQTVIAPGKSATATTRLFAGAKEVRLLDGYEDSQSIVNFGKAIDWGWFEVFAKPFFYLLDWLFRMVNNFGVAIMLLTLIVRGVMFPIAQRQFASMAAMRVVQPKIKALQERYKDDKPKLQQEMMGLYKTEKINPMAGCLPILIQIPVFYALYKVLMVAIEMRHQPFVLWIKDLSAPDPAHVLNLFGVLPFTVPAFLGIGILAILLGITMWLQFKLNPAPADPIQQQVFAIMPWMMMFIMAPFAAGLLVYWITNNILTIAQQKWLYSRHPAMREPVKA
ncbi:MAG: membrane protein insertase YidC [Pseudomonadota bacterium]